MKLSQGTTAILLSLLALSAASIAAHAGPPILNLPAVFASGPQTFVSQDSGEGSSKADNFTVPTVPPNSLLDANTLGADALGSSDGRVEESHDGWERGFQAYSEITDPQGTFWLHINDRKPDC